MKTNYVNIVNSKAHDVLVILASVVVLSLVAQISIPLQPVPITLQSTSVVLIGLILGSKRGLLAVASYLMLGLIGYPVFANMEFGIATFLSAKGGYLVGFLPASYIAGFLAEKGFNKTITQNFIIAIIGNLFIFTFGLLFLANLIGLNNAYLFGIKPFLITEIIKCFVLAIFATKIQQQ